MDDALRILLIEPGGAGLVSRLLADQSLPALEVAIVAYGSAITQVRADPNRYDIVIVSISATEPTHLLILAEICTERSLHDHPPFLLVIRNGVLGKFDADTALRTCLQDCLDGETLTAESLWRAMRVGKPRQQRAKPGSGSYATYAVQGLEAAQIARLEAAIEQLSERVNANARRNNINKRRIKTLFSLSQPLNRSAESLSLVDRVDLVERWQHKFDKDRADRASALHRTATGLIPTMAKAAIGLVVAIFGLLAKRWSQK